MKCSDLHYPAAEGSLDKVVRDSYQDHASSEAPAPRRRIAYQAVQIHRLLQFHVFSS